MYVYSLTTDIYLTGIMYYRIIIVEYEGLVFFFSLQYTEVIY